MFEIAVILLVAGFIIGGAELLIFAMEVPQYVLPRPSQIAVALVTEWGFLQPHVLVTLYELAFGFAIGASIGFVLAAVITQFPFVEKIVTPYILLLVTTPMLALVPLLVLRFGFGSEPRIIAVALASGPMVMINSATGFRRVDLAKIALARSFGANTLQIFTKIPNSNGNADDHRRTARRLDFRAVNHDCCGNGRRGRRARQQADLLLVNGPNAAILRSDHPAGHHGHLVLRVFLLGRQKMGGVARLSAASTCRKSLMRDMQLQGGEQ